MKFLMEILRNRKFENSAWKAKLILEKKQLEIFSLTTINENGEITVF